MENTIWPLPSLKQAGLELSEPQHTGGYCEAADSGCEKLTSRPIGVNVMLLNPNADGVAGVIVEEGVKVVTTGAGSPAKYMDMWKAAGVKVIPVVASVAMAKMMERSGADAVVAEGMESGGHIRSATTMTLVPQVVDAVNIPVIAAGGIADGRGFRRGIYAWHQAVQMGTRFVAASESIAHDNYKQKVIKARDIDSEIYRYEHRASHSSDPAIK